MSSIQAYIQCAETTIDLLTLRCYSLKLPLNPPNLLLKRHSEYRSQLRRQRNPWLRLRRNLYHELDECAGVALDDTLCAKVTLVTVYPAALDEVEALSF